MASIQNKLLPATEKECSTRTGKTLRKNNTFFLINGVYARKQTKRVLSEALPTLYVVTDVCIAFSRPGPHLIKPDWIKLMARDVIVFACANPTPEIWSWEAKESGARIVATGRGDFPNQLNNSFGFSRNFSRCS